MMEQQVKKIYKMIYRQFSAIGEWTLDEEYGEDCEKVAKKIVKYMQKHSQKQMTYKGKKIKLIG